MQLMFSSPLYRLFLKGKERSAHYLKTTTTAAHTLLADLTVDPENDDNVDHPCLILVEVTEAFATGSGAQPTFKIGQTGTVEKFLASATLTDAAQGLKLCLVGTLTHADDLIITATVATGTATGAIRVTVVAFPPSQV